MGDELKSGIPPVTPSEEEQELEYRPFVKYVGLGLVGLFVLSAGYASFALGHKQGYDAGISSGMVESSINTAAVQSLSGLLQLSAADDATLQAMAANPGQHLAWINDSSVRREAEWLIGCTLLQRGHAAEATPLLDALFAAAPQGPVWTHRAAVVAECLMNERLEADAVKWYRLAADRARDTQQQTERLHALTHLAVLLQHTPEQGDAQKKELEQLQQEASAPGMEALRVLIETQAATRLRTLGQHPEADAAFRKVADTIEDTQKSGPLELICYGIALRECGDSARAEQMFSRGLSGLTLSLPDTLCRLAALRQLAIIEQEKGNTPAALALLTRAEGAAAGRIEAENAFWPCLFEQRGWMYLLMDDFRNAHADFEAALKQKPHRTLQIQAMEGMARCMLENEQAEEALNLLTECLQLRNRHMSSDTASQGRVALLLAHAVDMAGRHRDAVDAYARAAELLQGDSPEQKANRFMALSGKAHAYAQLEEWDAALKTWEAILPLTDEGSEERTETENQIRDCRCRLKLTDPEFTADLS